MNNVAFAVLFIVKCRSITPILMISAIPAYHSPPYGGGALWGLALWGICAFHLEHKRSDEVVADDTGEIAHESDPCDLLHVPSEGDLLQTHNHYSGCATYDEH